LKGLEFLRKVLDVEDDTLASAVSARCGWGRRRRRGNLSDCWLQVPVGASVVA
jgi:hypothetical protein